MLQTISTATYITIQGDFVRAFPDGRVMVRVGDSYHLGRPVQAPVRRAEAAAAAAS